MMGSTVIDEPATGGDPRLDPEALIEQARRRTRRRRVAYAAAVGALIVGGFTAFTVARGGTTEPSSVTPSSRLTVDARAFRGHGLLAFVSKRSLYVLDGASGRLVHVGDPGHTAADPTLSRDGRWLAYVESAGASGAQQLWLARANGADAHRVASVTNAEIVGWSPSRDALAVVNRPAPNWTCGSRGATTSVDVLTPPAALRAVYTLSSGFCHHINGFYGAVWSPDGRSLAVATTQSDLSRSGSSQLLTINLATGARRIWFARRNTRGVCPDCVPTQAIPDLAGWWPKRGIGFWEFSSSISEHTDGFPLDVISAPGARPVRLGTGLSDGTQTAVAASTSGALATVHATWRDIGTGGTEVQTCAPGATRCAPVPGASVWSGTITFSCHPSRDVYCARPKRSGAPDSGITLDPSWSPNGSLLAYVAGPAVPQDSTATAQWLNQHQLFLYDPASGKSRRVAGTDGVSAPQWSADGRSILYVSHDSLWLLNLRSATSVRIAGPLFGGASFAAAYNAVNFYHQVPFTAQFGWSS